MRSSKDQVFLETFGDGLILAKCAVLKEFAGDAPILRINLFAIFRMCLQLTHELAPDISQIPILEDLFDEAAPADLALVWIDIILEEIVERSRHPSNPCSMTSRWPIAKASHGRQAER